MRRATKLLSVALVLAAAPASAETVDPMDDFALKNCDGALARSATCEAEKALVQAKTDVRMYEFYERFAVEALVAEPRRLPNGAPACGNVTAKMTPKPCTAEVADLLAAQRRTSMLEAVERADKARKQLTKAQLAFLRELTDL